MTCILRLFSNAARPVTLLALWPAILFFLVAASLGGATADKTKPSPACQQDEPFAAAHRETVHRNYIEIVYDAQSRKVWWLDHNGEKYRSTPAVITENSVFAPVIFAKERIIVTICNAKFNSEASTSTTTTVIPESGLDIRGNPAAANIASVMSTTQPSVQGAKGPTPEGPAGAAPPQPKTAADYAQLAVAYYETFLRLKAELDAVTNCDAGEGKCPPDTVPAIQERATALCGELRQKLGTALPPGSDLDTTLCKTAASQATPPQEPDPLGDQAAFDSFSARTKNLVDNLNNLAATIAAGDYLNRATALAGKYAELAAVKLQPESGSADTSSGSSVTPPPLTVPELLVEAQKLAQDANQDVRNTSGVANKISQATASICADLLARVGDMDLKLDADQIGLAVAAVLQRAKANLLAVQAAQQGPASPTQTEIAQRALKVALDASATVKSIQAKGEKLPKSTDIDLEITKYLPQQAGQAVTFKSIMAMQPIVLFKAIDNLTTKLKSLHATAGEIFKQMNQWREDSRVTLTSVVTPPGGNAVITVGILLHDAYAPFAFGAPPKKDAGTDTPKSSAGTITTATATATGPKKDEVRRVLVEVHRRADANLVGGIIGSTIPVRAFGVQPGTPTTTTSGSGSTATTSTVVPYYAYQSQNDHYQIQGMAGIDWYPLRRDFYPRYLPWWKRMFPGLLFGTSVTATGFFIGGLDFEPVNGLDFIFGGEVGPVKQLAPGLTLGPTGSTGPYFASTDTVPTRQKLAGGFVFGIGFDLSVFSAVFSSSSAPSSSSTPATPATPAAP